MNISNMLTISRIILAFIIAYLLIWHPGAYFISFILFLIAILTDYLDGAYARKKKIVTDFGKLVDPIADKVLILLILISFAYIKIIEGWMVILIGFREIVVTLIRIRALKRGKILAAEKAGKFKTICQMVAILVIFGVAIFLKNNQHFCYKGSILNISVDLMMLILVIITLISAIGYIKDLRIKNKEQEFKD